MLNLFFFQRYGKFLETIREDKECLCKRCMHKAGEGVPTMNLPPLKTHFRPTPHPSTDSKRILRSTAINHIEYQVLIFNYLKTNSLNKSPFCIYNVREYDTCLCMLSN